jgi:hypothetical protein
MDYLISVFGRVADRVGTDILGHYECRWTDVPNTVKVDWSKIGGFKAGDLNLSTTWQGKPGHTTYIFVKRSRDVTV